jgi:ABC-type long-subunit fatty acid transport system fused permease/ATPase subunit
MVIVLDATCTLAVFTPILVDMGKRVTAPHWSRGLGDTWLVSLAVWSALVGVLVAGVIGRKLIGLEVNNQRVEADLRRELVLLETAPASVCCASNEDEAGGNTEMNSPSQAFSSLWDALRDNYHRLFLNFMSLNAWLATFEQYMTLVPYITAAPLLFAPEPLNITLGTLVELSNSFGKVFDALNVVGDNWGSINEFCSCVVRLKQFEKSVNRWTPDKETSGTHGTRGTRGVRSSGETVLVARGAPRSHDPDISPTPGGIELKSGRKLPSGCEPPHSDGDSDSV